MRLARNPVAIMVVMGACLMPSLYAWFCIAANWDPYQHTNAIKVAVANLDEGASLEGAHTNLGEQVVAKLRDNDQLGWQFVSRDEAVDGVDSGAYYAAIVIPETFSEDFGSLLAGERTQPHIDYYVNEKASAVVPKITDAGASTLEGQIDQEFAHAVSESAAQTMRSMGIETQGESRASSNALEKSLERAQELTAQAKKLAVQARQDLESLSANSSAEAAASEATAAQTARILLEQTAHLASTSEASLDSIGVGLGTALEDIRALQDSAAAHDVNLVASSDPSRIAQLVAQPIQLETHVEYPVRNYGSGVAPFYISLALWVTGFILAAILHTRMQPRSHAGQEETLSYAQAYFARLLLFAALSLVSAAFICLGCLAMGVQCESPAAFLAAGLISALVDTAIIYSLVQAFRHIGRALAVVLLIVQVPGSAGMYPIEMMPSLYQLIHPLLPFTYSIGALRETIAGVNLDAYLANIGHLLLFVPLALVIGLGLGKALRKRGLSFEERLAESGLFEYETEKPRETP